MQIVIVFFIGLFLFSSCSGPQKDLSPKGLRLAIAEDPMTLDPRKGGDVLSAHLQLMLFEGLVKLHPDGSITPAQCHSYTLSSDQKTYTFHLGKTFWSDGTQVTAYDFERTWKDILSPTFPSPNAHLFYVIKQAKPAKRGLVDIDQVGISAPDPYTLIVELEAPTPYFLGLISFCVFSPTPPKINSADKSFISNGPFILSKWLHENELLLKKNPYYSKQEDIGLDFIHLSIVRDETTAFQMYEKGEIDLIGSPFFTPSSEALTYLPAEELLAAPVAATTYITFNTNTFPFSNKHLRQAFGLAIHREELVQQALDYKEKAALSAIPPCLIGNGKKIFPLDSQKEEAKQLFNKALEELNMTVKELENKITYLYSSSRNEQKLAQVLQQQWLKTLGIQVKIQSTERKILLDALSKKNYFFAQASYRAQYFDPISILERFEYKEDLKNYSSWESPQYQALLKQSTFQSGPQRIHTLEKAESLLLEEMPLAPLIHLNLHYLKKPYLRNIELSPAGGIFFERLSLEFP
ncbi:MAG: peptide ABC transporter substrate-binding protein [Verrucomicrobia bacterium]|nr:peptide ABC transporter substrate-binding protein [Verrucomicrobiota bacterium]